MQLTLVWIQTTPDPVSATMRAMVESEVPPTEEALELCPAYVIPLLAPVEGGGCYYQIDGQALIGWCPLN